MRFHPDSNVRNHQCYAKCQGNANVRSRSDARESTRFDPASLGSEAISGKVALS